MKKILFVIAMVCMACSSNDSDHKERSFLVVKSDGDTLRIKADMWKWDWGTDNCVIFRSRKGNQYISGVKDIIIEDYEDSRKD